MANTTLAPGYWRDTAIAALVAAVGVVILHLIFGALDASMVVETPQGTNEVTVVLAAVFAVAFTLIGAIFGWIMARFTPRAGRIWLMAAVIAIAAQGVNAFIAADDTVTGIALNAEHLAVFSSSLVWVYPHLRGESEPIERASG